MICLQRGEHDAQTRYGILGADHPLPFGFFILSECFNSTNADKYLVVRAVIMYRCSRRGHLVPARYRLLSS